jgi:hypothetical protein
MFVKTIVFLILAATLPLPAQHEHHHAGMSDGMGGMNPAGGFLMRQASGTSMNPTAWPMPMVMSNAGGWHFMFMGQAFIAATQQSGPRGADKVYSPNWGMISAVHSLGKGSVMLTLMPTLDPLTVTHRSYPLLFQTGESAFGRPLVDRQHPHELIMGLGVQYARPLGESTMFQAYFAPVGEPALGPVAFPHRASAYELPQATLAHHWQDSTHIANEVVTVAVKHRWMRVEASGYYGREPDENRWNIDHGPIDSWSTRLSVFPSENWAAQVSMGRLRNPEVHEEGDVVRATASLHYTRPMRGSHWSSSLIWGRNHKTDHGTNSNSYTLESLFPVTPRNLVTGRAELVDKDELFPDVHHAPSYRVGAWTAGYTRELGGMKHLASAIGANVTAYTMPGALERFYDTRPWGVTVFLRFRLQ